MRPLLLHVSALNDAEYDLYTTSLKDLAVASDTNSNTIGDDARYDRMCIGVREARAWLRGRFSDVPASDIDAILKLFSPSMLPSDSLTGGQFFAALRLVVHAQSGKGVDRALAFVQASPKPAQANDITRPPSPPKRPIQAPPSHPDRQKPPPATGPLPSESNPFMRRSIEQSAAPVPIDHESTATLPHRHNKISHNPFLNRDKPDASGVGVAISPDKTVVGVNHAKNGKLPPLPPRKPLLLAATPRRLSDAVPVPVTSTAYFLPPSGPPLIPSKPTHITSPLMRQSLEASKHGQTMKRAEEQLERERVLQVLKSSSSSSLSSNTRTRSLSPSKQVPKLPEASISEDATFVPPLPHRRKPSLPSSSSSSLPSLEQVASATLPSMSAPFRPPLPSRDMLASVNTECLPAVAGPGSMPPPTHPDRRASVSNEPNVNDSQPSSPVSPRVARSKSINYPGPSASLPPPPPRRKRPESMQLTPTSDTTDLPPVPSTTSAHPHMRTASLQGLSRHLSLSHDKESADSAISNIQKTINNLQLKAQPKLDAVRYKAEAGISRRGYFNHSQLGGGARWREEGEEGLMKDTRLSAANADQDPYSSEPTTDEEPSPCDGTRGERKNLKDGGPYREFLTESDHLKWPAGAGWRPL